VGVLSKESRVNCGSGEVVVSTLSNSSSRTTNRRLTQKYSLVSARCQLHLEIGCKYKSPIGALQSLTPSQQTQLLPKSKDISTLYYYHNALP
jgi:hypothetical protein